MNDRPEVQSNFERQLNGKINLCSFCLLRCFAASPLRYFADSPICRFANSILRYFDASLPRCFATSPFRYFATLPLCYFSTLLLRHFATLIRGAWADPPRSTILVVAVVHAEAYLVTGSCIETILIMDCRLYNA